MADLESLEAIRRLTAIYAQLLDSRRIAEWGELFTRDAVYEVYGKTLRGRDEIAALLVKAPHGVHIGGAARIEIAGGRADTVQNYVFHGQDDKYSNKGWYYRTLVRTEAGWKISHTRVEFQKPSQ